MRAKVVLAVCLLPRLAGGQSLAEVADREAMSLVAEQTELKRLIEEGEKNARLAREQVEADIEARTTELVRLRARTADLQRSLPAGDRSASVEDQRAELAAVNREVAGWLSRVGARGASIPAAIEQVGQRGRVRVQSVDVFDVHGQASRRSVIRLGRVAAVSADRAATHLLLPVQDDAFEVLKTAPGVRVQGAWVRPVVLYDPKEPPDAAMFAPATWRHWLASAGPLAWPLVGLALLALLIAVERVFFLGRAAFTWQKLRGRLRDFEERHDWSEAERLCVEKRFAPLSRPFAAVLSRREMPASQIEERATEEMLKLRPLLNRRLSFIGITAAVAPLLGLLGTVTGMIATFGAITVHGTGDPRLLSDGISEALLTTQMGLAVAIPTLLTHTALRRWAAAIFHDIELRCLALLHHIEDFDALSRESWAKRDTHG